MKCSHTAAQAPSPLAISRTSSLSQTETLHTVSNDSSFPFPPAPGNHHSTLFLYESDYPTSYQWNHTVFAFLLQASYFKSSRFIHAVAYVWTALLFKSWIIFQCIYIYHIFSYGNFLYFLIDGKCECLSWSLEVTLLQPWWLSLIK